MTGFNSKRDAAADKLQKPDALTIAYQSGFYDGKKAALAQPVQEPVAWAIYDKRGGSKSLHWPENHSPDGDATKFNAVPLYTAPPQREWVGLTDADIADCMEMSIQKTCRAVEAKLKEKNT